MLKCQDCDLRYEVIWDNDGQESPCEYCPRCGSQELIAEDEDGLCQ
jgi:rRNA maturation endonuclease Nob1